MTGHLFPDLRLLHSIPHRRLQHVHINIRERFELDAIAGHARLAEFLSVGLGEIGLVVQPDDIDRDPGRVRADADLIEVARLALLHRLQAVSDVGVGDGFAVCVLAVQEPQLASRHRAEDAGVQRAHVAALGLGLRGEIALDLPLDGHGVPRFADANLAAWLGRINAPGSPRGA